MSTMTEAPAVKVGDIFASSWGYDQTNVDFYEVVGVTPSGKSVRIVSIASKVVEGDAYSERVAPVPGSAREGAVPIVKRIRSYGPGDVYLTISSYAVARLVEPGETLHQSGPYGGH